MLQKCFMQNVNNFAGRHARLREDSKEYAKKNFLPFSGDFFLFIRK